MKARVLIVDDEPDVLDLVDFKLSASGFDVLRADTGVEALRKARTEAPDVIVLDLMLPDLNGLTVCQILHDQPKTRHVPIVVFSALDRAGSSYVGSKSGVSHWLSKSSNLDQLLACVRAAMTSVGKS
jgi:DNA-binding response OmpR family regulator